MSAGPLPKGYYETVDGINWVSGYACKKILARGPEIKYVMGIEKKRHIIYDVAYSAEETIAIGTQIATSQGLNMNDIYTEAVSENTGASLWYIVQKHYPKPELSKIYKIEIKYSEENKHSFDEWCERVKGRRARKAKEKMEWFSEWKSAGH